MNNNTHIVIMAGGIGSRFWPISTPEYPKQFIDILGVGKTLIQLTVERFLPICPVENMWVVTNERYSEIVKQQIPNIPDENILKEPEARNTAPCIAYACWKIKKKDAKANVVVTPADAVVMNTAEFKRVIDNSLAFTEKSDAIVTIGIKPNRPETGYGYVQAGQLIGDDIHAVEAFKEKPNRETAEEYLAAGNYLWNAGIFVWNVETITAAITKYKPQIAALMDQIMAGDPVETIFPTAEKVSIDYAVMEPAAADGHVYTHPASFGWSDLGNWQSLHEKLQKDECNNAVVGNVKLVECNNCVVHIEGNQSSPFKEDKRGSAILQGLDGYIVSEKGGQILVCKRSEEQRIKGWNS